MKNIRIGLGTDYHQLVDGRKLMLAGVEIPYHKGALGHSDADVLIHALCDALLGALSLGDIGSHFPDSDQKFKNIDSEILLQKTHKLVSENNYSIANIDSVISLEEPKIAKYIPQMKSNLAKIFKTNSNNISIKAGTTEKMGFIGRGEGIMAQAVVLLYEKMFKYGNRDYK